MTRLGENPFMQDDINEIADQLKGQKLQDIYALGLVDSEIEPSVFVRNQNTLSMKLGASFVAFYISDRNSRAFVKLSVNQKLRFPKVNKSKYQEFCISSIYQYYLKEETLLTLRGLSVFGDFSIENGSLLAERIELTCKDQRMKTLTFFIDPSGSEELKLQKSFKKRHKVMFGKRPLLKTILF